MPKPTEVKGPMKHIPVSGGIYLTWWVTCPGCELEAMVDREQLKGEVSIDCPHCDYHEAHDLRDMVDESL